MPINSLKKRLKPYKWIHYLLTNNIIKGDELWTSRRFFSQFGEDAVLENWFGNKSTGFYIEVGAYDPLVYSNTYWFYAKGWKGICIEPDPTSFENFKTRRPRDLVLNLAVSSQAGEAEFLSAGPISGIMDENFVSPKAIEDSARIKVKTDTLKNILSTHLSTNQQIDFMSVDCEGHDLAVLESNDWHRNRPSLLLAEDHAKDPGGPLFRKMDEWDYEPLYRIGLTMFFKAREFNPE